MLFNTYTYALYLPLVFLLYQALPLRGRQAMLLLASYVFYCWETPVYGVLLLVSTVLDFSCGLVMTRLVRQAARRAVLMVSVCGNLGLLGFFKYGDFFASNVAGLGRLFGFDSHWEPMGYILPVGISFYTFQTMSYTLQLYRRQIKVCRDPLSFALFVSFFPQLVAGPIERASHLLPQLSVYHRVKLNDILAGGTRIVFGLFRKMVLADRFSILVDRVFASPGDFPTYTVWIGVLCFWGQIYFDFAGYADIAIGSARLFGIRLTENFRRPLLARSMADFWARWHITLTSWLRDYLFNPMGGFRKGAKRAAVNGIVVLMLCGLWHGAAWHFVMWGAYESLLLVGYYAWKSYSKKRWGRRQPGKDNMAILIGSVALVFACNSVATIFFRSPDMATMGRVISGLVGRHAGASLANEWYVWVFTGMLVVWLVVEFMQEYMGLNEWVRRWPWWLKALGMSVVVLAIALTATNLTAPYLYFQF